nr:E3 ubiquitin-protein ligase RNF144B-like [Tanacetum cinerariifolium]
VDLCAQCKVAWHAGMDCRQFQMFGKGKIDENDILLMNLAKTKNWRRYVGDKLQNEDRSTSDDVAAGSSSSTDPSHNIVEDFNFEAFLNQDEKSLISDKKYIEEMELQEALMMSSSASLIPS